MGTYVPITSQGSAYARFRRALATGNGFLAWTAASELESLDLADALALCLVLATSDRARYERAAVRWHARLCAERALSMPDAHLAFAALHALPTAGASALTEICEKRGLGDVAAVIREWQDRGSRLA